MARLTLKGANNDPSLDNPLAAYASNDEAWSAMGKYAFDLGGGGFKDEGPASKLTLFAGYTHIALSGSDATPSAIRPAGYAIALDTAYLQSTKVLDSEWAGAKYELPPAGASRAPFITSIRTLSNPMAMLHRWRRQPRRLRGHYNQGSFLIDYAFNKHFDVYPGATYAIVDGGMAAGYSGTPCGVTGSPACGTSGQVNGTKTSIDTAAVVTGFRLKF